MKTACIIHTKPSMDCQHGDKALWCGGTAGGCRHRVHGESYDSGGGCDSNDGVVIVVSIVLLE